MDKSSFVVYLSTKLNEVKFKTKGALMKKSILYIFLFVVVLSASILTSRDFRVQKIPNGGKFSCANCHVSAGGGGARNLFGLEVEGRVTPGSTQNFWNAQLASLDSDGDGFTNGEELQDPSGTWTGGSSGNFSLVTNPGDPSSKPIPTSVEENFIPNSYKLLNNYPNPFNPTTTIAFEIPEEKFVLLKIYNINGEHVKTILEENLPAGRHLSTWNGRDEYGNEVSSGVYIYRITAGSFEKSARMILMK